MAIDTLDAAARLLTYGVGGGIFLNSLDELHVDANYFLRGVGRRAEAAPARDATRAEARARKAIAILVPAWNESDVIEQMLEHNLAALEYDHSRYDVFVGTYPNDPDTQARVDAVARRAPNVHKVVLPHDGPTSKGDCLNGIYDAVVDEERRRAVRFEILLMHDAEDVIHPASLRLYDSLIPPNDFVQTPVFSLPLSPGRFTAATYIDEFAEHHLRDMPVREAIGGLIPSAGVGSAFARDAFDEIALAHGSHPFDTESLTEDYDIGLRFRLAGKRVHFASQRAERDGMTELVATREYFPSRFGASVRQRSRWVLGITLQTWERVGWKGSLPVLYCLWRDRKALITNALVLAAYALGVYAALRAGVALATHSGWTASRVVPTGSPLEWLLTVNLVMLVWRAGMKAHFVGRLYGTRHAFLSAPRLVVGNVIGIAATARAIYQYGRHRLTREPLRWLKTTHAFIDAALIGDRRRLGECLLSRRVLAPAALEEALRVQRATGIRLGEVLASSGVVSVRRVTEALAAQLAWRTTDPDPRQIPLALLERLPEEEAERMNVLPLEQSGASVAVAGVAPLGRDDVARLESLFQARVEPRLASAAVLARARARAYRRLVAPGRVTGVRLGERLVGRHALGPDRVQRALEEQSETGEMLGELLVRARAVSGAAVSDALAPDGLPFCSLAPEAVDPHLVARLGAGFCALYCVAPLARKARRGKRIVASAYRVDPIVARAIGLDLDEEVAFVLAPSIEIRLALAFAAHRLSIPAGIDGAELTALTELGLSRSAAALTEAAHRAGHSPVDHLEAIGRIDTKTAARARARALGVPLAFDPETKAGAELALPPSLSREHGLVVREMSERSLVLACPRPRPRLARDVASLFSQSTIVWQVLVTAKEHDHGRTQAA